MVIWKYILPGYLPSTIGIYRYLRRHIGGHSGIYAGIMLERLSGSAGNIFGSTSVRPLDKIEEVVYR